MTLRFNLSVNIISSVNLRIYSSIPLYESLNGEGGDWLRADVNQEDISLMTLS